MPRLKVVGVRMTDELLERIDRMAPKLALATEIPGVTVTRSDVLRAAVERGLAGLEMSGSGGAPAGAEVA